MKNRTLFAIASLLVLAACGSSARQQYALTMTGMDEENIPTIANQSANVIQRRLESMGMEGKVAVDDVSASGTLLTVTAENQEGLDALTEQLKAPFSLRIMGQTPDGEKGDVTVEGHGSFSEAGITEKDILWVNGGRDPNGTSGTVQLLFTEEGLKKMGELFKKMKGKNVGLFVRGQLVSKLFVASEEIDNDITISGVPSPELATVFAEDVNVGTHVTFTPVQ